MAEEPPPLFGDDDKNEQKEEDDEDLFKSATEVIRNVDQWYFWHGYCRHLSFF